MATDDRDILELLLEDHQDFRELFDEVRDAEPQSREDTFHYLAARLAGHEAAEEAVVHSTVRDDVPGGEPIATARLEEESEAEDLLARMADMDVSSNEFTEALTQLRDDVLEHAQHEEDEEFPKLREHLGVQERRDLGGTFARLRDNGPTRPHPHTPQTPEVRAALGPIVGLFDRARDTAREAFNR